MIGKTILFLSSPAAQTENCEALPFLPADQVLPAPRNSASWVQYSVRLRVVLNFILDTIQLLLGGGSTQPIDVCFQAEAYAAVRTDVLARLKDTWVPKFGVLCGGSGKCWGILWGSITLNLKPKTPILVKV